MAERVAIARAVHQFMDEPPLVFSDPLALPIIGAAGDRWMRDHLELYRTEGMRRSRGVVVIRARFTEDELEQAVARGTTQYVILGAGLDTFAYRRRDLAGRLTVYEVDQPATQRWKTQRLAEAGIPTPPNLRLVPVDFTGNALAERLAAAGFRRDAPAFFSWLGVIYYLPSESILATLAYIADQQAASQVVFDFAVAEAALPAAHRHLFREFSAYNRTAGERWQTWFTPEEITGRLRGLGFAEIECLDAPRVTALYLSGRADGLLAGPLVGLVCASRPAGLRTAAGR
jgi:methyltransferase (TIGR00027 family)